MKIPAKINDAYTPTSPELAEKDDKAKGKIKSYADSKAYVKPSDISVGDTVLVKREKEIPDPL